MDVQPAMAATSPEVVGALAWWVVMLGVPLAILGRWMRRVRRAARRRGAGRAASGTGMEATPAGARFAGPAEPSAPARAAAPLSERRDHRLSPGTLEPLCRFIDFHRRLDLAVAELERRLSALPADRWRVERYPLTGERGNTLLVVGETGVFVISATYAPGHWDDIVTADRLATKIQQLLPGYCGEVNAAICHPFSSTRPRLWHRANEQGDWIGVWVTSGDSVVGWLRHFGTEYGLDADDLDRFDQLATPNWLKPAIPTASTWPPVPATAPPAASG